MGTCEYDSGSATGNRPLCSAAATHTVTYWNGSSGPFTDIVCARHVRTTEARVWPSATDTVLIGHVVMIGGAL